MRKKTAIAILILAAGLAGCAARQKTVTNLPAGVTQKQAQNWDTAIANLDKIANSISTLRQVVIALNQTTVTDSSGTHKVIPDGATYAAILTGLGKAAQAEQDAAALLQAQPKNWGQSTQTKVQNDVTIVQQQLSAILAQQLAGIKSSSAQTQVQTLISEIGSFATLILSLSQ